MSLNRYSPAVESSSSTFNIENLAEGEHEARLIYVSDLGLQRKEYKGEYKGDFQQIALGLEILGQSYEDDGVKKPRILWTKPFYIYKTMGEKGREFAYYKVFDATAKPETVPDWEAQLGKPCNVIVAHTQGKGDKADRTYDNIADLTPIPAKYHGGVEQATLSPAIGNSDDSSSPAISALFGLAKMVWERRVVSGGSASAAPNGAAFDDDIPF